jgi:hypothetical protein
VSLLIIVLIVIAVVVVAALALNPLLAKRGDAAIEEARNQLGGRDKVRLIEPKAVGFGSEPDEAGGLRGQGVLAVGDDALVFVTWAPKNVFRIERRNITAVSSSAADPRGLEKSAVEVTFEAADLGAATASWRVPEIGRWLDVLDYDWGPEGRPSFDDDGI